MSVGLVKILLPYVKEIKETEEYGPQYYSQRGEDCPPRYDETKEEFLSNGEEYSYIFTSAGWVCYDMNAFNDNDPEIVGILLEHLLYENELEAQQIAQEFWAMIEAEAAALEVTVDYYLEEFFFS